MVSNLLMTYKGFPPYEPERAWVAANNWDGTFGTAIEVRGINLAVRSARLKVIEGSGNRAIMAKSSKVLAVPVTIRALAIPLAAYEVIMNTPVSAYGVAPNRYQQFETGSSDETSSFGLMVKARYANANGGMYFFWPFVTVIQDIEWRFDGDNYVATELRCEAIQDPTLTKADGSNLIERIRNYETLPNITEMPLL